MCWHVLQRQFQEESHVTINKALIGHSFQNLTAYAPHQCLSACVSSCRCLAFQLEGTKCELLDQDRSLTPGDFYDVQGYRYFDLNQELDRNVSKIFCIDCYFSDFINYFLHYSRAFIIRYFVLVHIYFFTHSYSICTRSPQNKHLVKFTCIFK